jgi:hypothetical protein
MRAPLLILLALCACSKDPSKPATGSGSGTASSAHPERGREAAESKDAAAATAPATAPDAGAAATTATADAGAPVRTKNPLNKLPKARLPRLGQPDAGADPAPPSRATAPGRGQSCDNGTCASGLQCIRYYGIAGTRGPEFTSCETPCPDGKGCPKGTTCMTVADGPGQVCR